MKRPISTLKFVFNPFELLTKRSTVAFSTLITIFVLNSIQTFGQVNCNVILACNDGVQISLDEDCNMHIEPAMILEASPYADDYFDVEAKLPDGTKLTQESVGNAKWPIINGTHVGKTLEVKVSLRGCGNSCWGTAVIEDKLPPVIDPTNCPCEQRITNFKGAIKNTSLTYNRPSVVAGCPGTPVNNVHYEVHNFALDANGTVDISLPSPSTKLALYSGTFDPANPCTNIIATAAQSWSGSLVTGINYVLVISLNTSVAPNALPPSGEAYTVFIDNRSGNVKSSVSASICLVACGDEDAILAQTATSAPNRPGIIDACGGTLTFSKIDYVDELSCSDDFSKVIRREWRAKDASGNESLPKTQYFYVKRGTLADVICPSDYIRGCGAPYAKLPSGLPSPSTTGYPTNLTCSNIQYYYEDLEFELCGAGVKVHRKWYIIDWCTGAEKTCSQQIKFEDTEGPVVTCPADLTTQNGSTVNPAAVVPVNSGTCTATWQVIPPIAVSDCSYVTWTVAFKLADSNGLPPANSTFVTLDGNTQVLGTKPGFAATISQTARPYTIVNLPLGRTWLKYTITDECGHSTDCFTELDVVDLTPPTAICEGTTVVSLDESGSAELYAESVDDHSLDNCEMGRFEIKRVSSYCAGQADDLQFGEFVNFCCEDVTVGYITVVLKVYDKANNSNECTGLVKVQNKRAPTISCPSNKTVTCGDTKLPAWASGTAAFDTTYFGKPTVAGVCSNLKFTSRIVSDNTNNKCKTGTIVREWYLVSDPNTYCRQTVTVVSPSFSSSNVTFPGTLTLATCDIDAADPDVTNSKPSVVNTGCRDIGITYTDQVFRGIDGVCVKILRHWKVIDWCTYNANNVIAEDIQTIKLTGSNPPSITGCKDVTVNTDGSCTADYTFHVDASDPCTIPDDLVYSWSLDLGANNTTDKTGAGNETTQTLDIGMHKITFTVKNICNKTASCSYKVTVSGTKKPTPVCHAEVTWVMSSDGMAEVWASDFDLKSTGACGADVSKFAFDSAGKITSKKFSCADLPNGQVVRIPLQMYVFDTNGNSDFCDVVLVLQDSPLTNACPDVSSLLPSVSGRILTDNNESVQDIEVEVMNMTTSKGITAKTGADGKYTVSGVDVFDPKVVEASKNNDILNGVSTLDIVMIQRHILGIQPLLSPYKILAADVNNSKSITVADLSVLRKVLLGITTTFDNNTSWRFVPENYVFADINQPYNFDEYINIDSLFENKDNVNFIGVKVGDLNNSVETSIQNTNTDSRNGSFALNGTQKSFSKGEKVEFELKPSKDFMTSGMQFVLQFDPNVLQLDKVESAMIDGNQINLLQSEYGKVIVSYDAANGNLIRENESILTLEFYAKGAGSTDQITLSDQGINNEIYSDKLDVQHLTLNSALAQDQYQPILFQNTPNPFNASTIVAFDLPKSQETTLKVMDMTGKQVFNVVMSGQKGRNEIVIHSYDIPSSGVYYYQLETEHYTSARKMIFIE
ncbi:MAG: T9SS type A sorting domain-containing protein [Lewinellaceae bacterium]|nr:T9SS type A sorting domain-containing protein [Lewinellaceae bacterium]